MGASVLGDKVELACAQGGLLKFMSGPGQPGQAWGGG